MTITSKSDPATFSQPPAWAVAAMFANQAEWLALLAGESVWPGAATAGTSDLLLAGTRALAIATRKPGSLDAALDWLRKSNTGPVLIWAAQPDPAADLALHARGARESFRPRWMWHTLALDEPPKRATFDISLATSLDRAAWAAATHIPYHAPGDAGILFDVAVPSSSERRAWPVLARLPNGTVAGAGVLHVSPFDDRLVGAIYNLGVDPAWRDRGAGSAMTARLLRQARELGACGVALNATPDGERMYRRLGFVDVGEGATWSLPGDLLQRPPSPNLVESAQALGRGETEELDPTVARWPALPDGDSPIRFAARFGQRAAIPWLVEHGAGLDVVPLWTAGFRDMATGAMMDPRWIDARWGPEAATPLHDAIRLNDITLVRALLACGASPTIRDGHWRATPLEWARALARSGMLPLLERAASL